MIDYINSIGLVWVLLFSHAALAVICILLARWWWAPRNVASRLTKQWIAKITSLEAEQQRQQNEFERSKAQIKQQAEQVIAEKNDLLYRAIGELIVEHVKVSVALVYKGYHFTPEKQQVCIFLAPLGNNNGFQQAIAHGKRISERLEDIRQKLLLEYQLVEVIEKDEKERKAHAN